MCAGHAVSVCMLVFRVNNLVGPNHGFRVSELTAPGTNAL